MKSEPSLWYLTALASLPFCMPAGTFGGFGLDEGVALLLAALAFLWVFAMRKGEVNALTPIASVLLAFGTLLVFQVLFIPPVFAYPVLGLGATLLSAFLLALAIGAHSQLESITREDQLRSVCRGLILGMAFNACFALIQLGISIVDDNTLEVVGFLAQRNNFGDYLATGMVALCWQYANKEHKGWLFAGVLFLGSVALALSASRTVLIYCAIWFLMALFLRWRFESNQQAKRFAGLLALGGGSVLLAQVFIPVAVAAISSALGAEHSAAWYSGQGGFVRALGEGAPIRERIPEFTKAWGLFLDHASLGVGWGRYAEQSFLLQSDARFTALLSHGLFTHSHNSFLQILAEFGLPGGLLLLAGALCLLRGGQAEIAYWVGMTLLAMPLIHSMVEFPLWYSNFFILFIVIAAIVAKAKPLVIAPRGFSLVAFAAALVLVGLLFSVEYTMRRYQAVARPQWSHAASRQNVAILQDMATWAWWLDYPIALALVSHAEPNVPVDGLMHYAEKLNRYSPRPIGLMTEAVERAKLGGENEMRKLIRHCLMAYPYSHDYMENVIRNQADAVQMVMLIAFHDAEAEFINSYRRGGKNESLPWRSR